ncbi:metal-dependent hydrolase [[Mycobacterium] nativiensis]|uniref:Metal-dependent hydrolase n=1 Tax=[Mycobacterium] nativiensis TaxID=2855503 RepID=A0ABU5XWJ7_9MYCO|nr:metal-dependent hydrolase [Mycolicibacter sp. MYC340]MEB3031851.1 metal-dependent hydrolase [Mycolicibacter sp. MYC340]
MPSGASSYADQAHVIAARNVHFDWEGVPLHYLPGEPVATQFFNFMHLVLPEAERVMASTLAESLPYIDDERLHEEVVGFVGQEAMHASSHEGVRDHLERNGVPVQPVIDRMQFLLDGMLGDHGLTGRAKKEWLNERLAMFAAMEHFTAFIGQWFLDNDRIDDMHPMMLDLIRWHGAEEVEHRSVVFDAFQYLDGSYARRLRAALFASGMLLALAVATAGYLVRHDPAPGKSRHPVANFFRATWRGKLPGLTLFVTELPKYLAPGFHPSTMGSLDAALNYLATSPAARAAQ